MKVAAAIASEPCREAVRAFVDKTPGLELIDSDSQARPLLSRIGKRADILVTDVVVASGRDSQLVIETAVSGVARVAVMATVAPPNARNLRRAGIAVHRVFDEQSRDRELRIMFRVPPDRKTLGERMHPRPVDSVRDRPEPAKNPSIVVVGASTGGPQALVTFLSALPERMPVPVAIVQHVADTPGAANQLARVLTNGSGRQVVVAGPGIVARPGPVVMAPEGKHMRIDNAAGRVSLTATEPRQGCRPSVDELFESTARNYGNRAIAVMLTGMGTDGLEGSRMLYEAGSLVIAQDQKSSAVWGMPGAVVRAGLADEVLALGKIGRFVGDRVGRASRV